MEKTNYILAVLAIFSILIVSCTPTVITKEASMEKDNDGAMQRDESDTSKTTQTNDQSMQKNEAMRVDDSSTQNKTMARDEAAEKQAAMEKAASFKGRVLAGTTSPYIEFNKEDYDNALKSKKKILLYFYASWCPLCRAEEPKTFAAFNEINDPDLVGFRVNYKDSDTDADETALAKEFGVSYQHTKVILKDGQRVGKFPDSWNKDRYIEELNKV